MTFFQTHFIIAYVFYLSLPTDPNKAHVGTVAGNRVVIDNKSFGYTPTVDLYFGDGDKVACILPENANSAAVVGVF